MRHRRDLRSLRHFLVSVVVVSLILQWIPVWLSLVVLILVLAPYVTLTAMHPPQIAKLGLPRVVTRFLTVAIGHAHRDARGRRGAARSAESDYAWVAVSLILIVVASMGAVYSSVELAALWGISQAVIGMLILASLTSIPNVIAAVRLAREGRGAAVVSESLNSNTLNILAGICLPALIFGFSAPTRPIVFATLWLLVMKCFAIAASSHRRGLHRGGGAVLIALYLVFAIVIVCWR